MELSAASFRIISHDSAGRYRSYDMFYMGGGTASVQWWNGGCRAQACPNILSSSILKAGLEAPAIETKAGLEPDEWSATNQELRPHPRRSQPFCWGARQQADVTSQSSSQPEMVRNSLSSEVRRWRWGGYSFLGILFGFSAGQIGRKRPLKKIKAVVSVVLGPENMQHNKSWDY